jgi:hypothetical protein
MKGFAALLLIAVLPVACGKGEAEAEVEAMASADSPSVTTTPAEEAELQLKAWERLDTPVEADLVVPWTDAPNHLDQVIGVEGEIVDSYNSGRACFLNFTKDWKGEFYVAILGSNLSAFDQPPEKKFLNKRVRVVGKVKMYKGRPQIVIDTPQHIQILD